MLIMNGVKNVCRLSIIYMIEIKKKYQMILFLSLEYQYYYY